MNQLRVEPREITIFESSNILLIVITYTLKTTEMSRKLHCV